MGLRTVEQYLEGLRDGREIYFEGELVPDVTAHHGVLTSALHGSLDYSLQFEPGHRELAVVRHERTGEEVSRYYTLPRTADDVAKRRQLIEEATRAGSSLIPFLKDVGSDVLFMLSQMAPVIDAETGSEYAARVQAYLDKIAHEDLSMAAAVTDVKGDRSKRPGLQSDPDMYVRIVERRPDGIVVRGAKAHISSGPIVDELIIIPTRAMTADDADYAVAFAVPAATKGLRMICRSERPGTSFDFPISGRHYILEALVIFEDVFVPWERVFLAGEWKYAGTMANNFAQWHRFTALSYKTPIAELLLGTAIVLAQSNGIDKVRHIREHIVDLAIYLQMVKTLGRTAALSGTIDANGIATPDELSTNLGKYYFAERYHDMVRRVQEIAGGIMVTAPGLADALGEVTGPDIERYLAGAEGWGGIDRMRVMKLARDLTASDYGGLAQVAALHAEGSTEAQRMMVVRETDFDGVAAYAKAVAGVGKPVERDAPATAAVRKSGH